MRLLFVGNADNPLLVDLALELKRLRPGAVIDIISERPSRHPRATTAFRSVHCPSSDSRLRSERGVKFFWYLFAYHRLLASTADDYDAVHVFYMSGIWGALAGKLARKGRKLVVTLFGSDVYRTTPLMEPFQRRLLQQASTVTASNADTLTSARRAFDLTGRETRVVRFGLRPLDLLAGMRNIERSTHKGSLGIPADRTLVVAGTNASRRQHHMDIIAAVRALPEEQRDRVFLVVPMTMGGDAAYIGEVKAACVASGLEHRVITGLMSDEELARLRCATDIMVQIQPTDQLSGAMQEHLFAGSLVITGAWLPYDVFREAGVRFWTVRDHTELGSAITRCLKELDGRRAECLGNADPIMRLSGWANNAPVWSALYDP